MKPSIPLRQQALDALPAVPLVIGALMGLALIVAGLQALIPGTEPEPPAHQLAPQPKPAAWKVKAWADSHCDRCGRGLTADPADGLYLVNRKPMWLHKDCAEAIRWHGSTVR